MRNHLKLGVGLVAIAMICACASAPKGPTDEELVARLVTNWMEAVAAKDLDAMMAIHSESFSNSETADKAAWKAYLEWIIASGFMDGAETDVSGAETTILEDKATVGPLVLSTAAGVFNMELSLAKEDAGWMVVSSEAR
jgi:hypothetical protein